MFWDMFKKSKKQADQPQLGETVISYALDEEDLLIEINMKDFSQKSMDDFARLLAGVSTMSFVPETIALIRDVMKERPEEYSALMEKAALYAKEEVEKLVLAQQDYVEKDAPYINPSDALK